jgi:hypothetical protein
MKKPLSQINEMGFYNNSKNALIRALPGVSFGSKTEAYINKDP